jgi:hypothetical protein
VRVLTALPLVAALAACGPVRSTSSLIAADVELEAARAAGAQKTAAYEYTAIPAPGARRRHADTRPPDWVSAFTFAQGAKKKARATEMGAQ